MAVSLGTDQDCLRDLIPLHALPNPRILDTTFHTGRMWVGLPWQPHERMDCYPYPNVTTVGDFRSMPADWTETFDIVVFDPPHDTERGVTSRLASRYGGREQGMQHAENIAHLFPPFLAEAKRVLRPKGVILAKLMDGTHRGRMQWVEHLFLSAVDEVPGLVACDRKVKIEGRAATQNNWQGKQVHHCRTDYVFWMVVRKGRC